MKPRALGHLMQLNRAARLNAISEGLALVAENVAVLGADVDLIRERGSGRSLRILAGHADEEAAKALILLDLLRMDRGEHAAQSTQLDRFSDHLARLIYAEVSRMSPADFAEVRRMVGTMRPSRYLEGPEGFEWLFRNRLLAAREEGLYVDYVHDEDGERWVTPAAGDEVSFGGPSPALLELIDSLARLGVFDPRGLEIVADVWDGAVLADDTHWQEILARNREVVGRLSAAGLTTDAATDDDAARVITGWTFPLSGLELSELDVSAPDLQADRERLSLVL